MHLVRLVVHNFRCFYQTHTIDFAQPGSRAVTIIHGENGAGKTNLLNALFWCLTGEFTPRFQSRDSLVNRFAYDLYREAECFVEVHFHHEGQDYKVVRSLVAGREPKLSGFLLGHNEARALPKPEQFIERLVPKALSRWFFFDAEAIGELELSGSDSFRKSLRRILGFELVYGLVHDLELGLTKKQGALARLLNSKELEGIQTNIENIERVLPAQRQKAADIEDRATKIDSEIVQLENQLRRLPQSKELQQQRSKLTSLRSSRAQSLKEIRATRSRAIGDSAPAVVAFAPAVDLEENLHVKENSGRLPAPFSEQLVEDILSDQMCVCGRPVGHGSPEEGRIRGLLQHAATADFNARVRSVQFLLKDIRAINESFPETLARYDEQIASWEREIGEIDGELRRIRVELEAIDVEAIRDLEALRAKRQTESRELHRQHAVLVNTINQNETKLADLRKQYDLKSQLKAKGKGVGDEIDKIKRLLAYVNKTLKAQEARALTVLGVELNKVLSSYLTKHFVARISPKTYRVELLDEKDRPVGESTGEGQVLKFAFISTIVALAGKKTQEKINFLAEPTIAPLVLDAPFSALDPEYQSAVAQNLASQTTQLVLMLSSAGWGEGVADTLNPHVGQRYALISRQKGPRGDKPLKKMSLDGRELTMNEYDAERDESVILELN